MKIRTAIATTLIFLASPAVWSQGTTQVPQDAAREETPMEEIVVIGQRSIMNLRLQVDQAVDRMYTIYNEVNTDDDFDIHCRREAPLGSNIKRKVCTPAFYSKAEAKASHYALTNNSQNAFMYFEYSDISRKNEKLRDNMKRLILGNPDLFNAVVEQVKLSQELKQQRRAYWNLEEE